MSRASALPLLLLALTAAGAASRGGRPQQGSTSTDQISSQWREGPVRYIITADEDREYIDLRDDESRGRFIERFWARRDTLPRTLINEYRREFWERVALANRLFDESTKPGWKTDMGRYYILLGPPDDRDTSQELGSMTGRANMRGSIVWRYSHSPNIRVGTGLQIVFVRDPSGEWRSTTDEAEISQALSQQMTGPIPDLIALGFPLPGVPAEMAHRQLQLDLGILPEVPTEEDLLTALVTAQEFFGAIPVGARYDFFAGASGSTISAITLSLHPDPLDPDRRPIAPDYLIVGRLDREEGEASVQHTFLRESDFNPGAPNTREGYKGPWLYQAVITLPPGHYRASFVAFDHASRRTGSFADAVEVPSFSRDELSLSSLCLSEAIEPVTDLDRAAPYVIGKLRVTPRLVPTYRNGDTFAVYYQVYRARTDPLTSAPDLSIEYQFFVSQGGGYLAIGRPIRFDSVGDSAQGWSFPLHDWPAADFRLRVMVTDTLTGQQVSRDVSFKVL